MIRLAVLQSGDLIAAGKFDTAGGVAASHIEAMEWRGLEPRLAPVSTTPLWPWP